MQACDMLGPQMGRAALTPEALRRFKLTIKRAAYKFGGFMHWIFFKPTPAELPEDTAQTSLAPLSAEDAGRSAQDMASESRRDRRALLSETMRWGCHRRRQ